jgi:serine/threonine kinase 32
MSAGPLSGYLGLYDWCMADNEVVNLNHFRLLRVVGKGAFGKVRIVEKKDTGLTFALKYIRKEEGTYSFLKLLCSY